MNDYPQYQCHKIVRAFKILLVQKVRGKDKYHICPEDLGLSILHVNGAWFRDFNPKPGDYVVFYEDGYISVSPAGPFEAGYTLMKAKSNAR